MKAAPPLNVPQCSIGVVYLQTVPSTPRAQPLRHTACMLCACNGPVVSTFICICRSFNMTPAAAPCPPATAHQVLVHPGPIRVNLELLSILHAGPLASTSMSLQRMSMSATPIIVLRSLSFLTPVRYRGRHHHDTAGRSISVWAQPTREDTSTALTKTGPDSMGSAGEINIICFL